MAGVERSEPPANPAQVLAHWWVADRLDPSHAVCCTHHSRYNRPISHARHSQSLCIDWGFSNRLARISLRPR